MKSSVVVVASMLALTSCSQQASDLVEKTKPLVIESNDNYQTVYRRVSKQYDCNDGAWAGAFASYQVDRELYTELGFGELALRLSNFGTNNYYHYVKVTKVGNGSRVEIHTGNSLGSDGDRKLLAAVATGERQPSCDHWSESSQ